MHPFKMRFCRRLNRERNTYCQLIFSFVAIAILFLTVTRHVTLFISPNAAETEFKLMAESLKAMCTPTDTNMFDLPLLKNESSYVEFARIENASERDSRLKSTYALNMHRNKEESDQNQSTTLLDRRKRHNTNVWNQADNCHLRHPRLWDRDLPMTALASPWRSGNTWLRHLLQQVTGIATSSVYCDKDLAVNGFPCECSSQWRRTIVIKTHDPDFDRSHPNPYRIASTEIRFDRAILLIRDPYDFIIANVHKDHMDIVPEEKYLSDSWRSLQQPLLNWWNEYNHYWLTQYEHKVLPVIYDRLVSNTEAELRRILDFLHWKYSETDIKCALRHKEGNFHRQKRKWTWIKNKLDIFDHEIQSKINTSKTMTSQILKLKFNMDWKCM